MGKGDDCVVTGARMQLRTVTGGSAGHMRSGRIVGMGLLWVQGHPHGPRYGPLWDAQYTGNVRGPVLGQSMCVICGRPRFAWLGITCGSSTNSWGWPCGQLGSLA